ncbi:hypothetical protein FFWV33_10590 [Flavobacterium faecale]|uniref:Addiction module protein n=1 Tax=Flavobacterium faecale TaxID=1355330 RepID=A0A2S1LDW0_9FLAO|nr:hypothetical protein [Flavobacterium faecale]AWG21940.1 hypothetical protein FFWV33_10590 [Flavobacterium faecale]
MDAIRQFIDVKGKSFQVNLPEGFTATRVEVIILPSELSNENEIPNWQMDLVSERIEAIKQNPDLVLEEDQFWNDLENEG